MTPRTTLLRRRARPRGFTLVELLVAVVAGLLVTLGAFAFAKASTRSFQQETRIANATSAATFGFRRLVADIERIAYLSPANIQREYRNSNSVCLQPGPTMPLGIQQLSGFSIDQGPNYTTSGTLAPWSGPPHNLAPDRLTVAGAFSSNEQYAIKSIQVVGSNTLISLQPNSGGVMRTANGDATLTPWTTNPGVSWGVFAPNRIVRLVDNEGFQHFGVVNSVQLANGVVQVLLANNPPLYMKGGVVPANPHPTCKGFATGAGAQLNVINRIRYEVRTLRNVPLFNSTLYNADVAAANDSTRMELVRYEIDAAGTIMAGTEELVAEYAIDLKFGATVAVNVQQGTQADPQLQQFAIGDAGLVNWFQAPSIGSLAPGPERVRSLTVRLAVRSREPDRDENLTATQVGAQPGSLFRYQVPGTTRYARVRTLQAEVALSNQWSVFY